MPIWRARLFRLVLKHSIGRRLRNGVLSVAELRKLDDVMIRSQRLPEGTAVAPVTLGTLPAEWVHGLGVPQDVTVLYFHGGAFVAGSPATHRELAARISRAASVPVLSPGYRLAPEHPFPAAVDDAKVACQWLLERGHRPGKLILGGDSSGGGLALQALLVLREEGLPLPRAAFFMSPVTDWVVLGGESFTTRAAVDPMVSPAQCRSTPSIYAGSEAADSPLLRPAEMDLTGLPPLWIHVGDHDVLLSDAQRLADRAAEAGVEVSFKVWPGMWHVFQTAARFGPEARQSIEELALFLRRMLDG
jgi:monoterpene epsilon-lactone hydrolase